MARNTKQTSQRPESAAGANAILTPDQIAQLWERGYTVIPRTLFGRDPYAVADAIQRPGMAQQWGDKAKVAEYRANGWRMVTNEAWPGLFAPYGAVGDVEIDQLVLMHKPQHQIDRVAAANRAKAHQNIRDWEQRQRDAGFSVEINQYDPNVDYSDQSVGTPMGDTFSGNAGPDPDLSDVANNGGMLIHKKGGAPTIDTTVDIPRNLMPHVKDILAERDALCQEAVNGEHDDIVASYDKALKENPHAPKWPTLRAIAMPKAIERIRAKLKAQEGTDDGHEAKGDTSDAAGTTGSDAGSVDGDADRGRGAAAGDAPGSGGDGAAEFVTRSEPDGGASGVGRETGASTGIGSEPGAAPADQSSDQS